MSVIRLVFVEPIILLLKFLFTQFHAVTGNYGLSLLLMSLAVTLLTTPLYYLAEHWRRIEVELQNKMAPELASVRTHYQGQKRFYLTRNVHRLHGYSPWLAIRASFGLLVQIPFFFAAYLYLRHYEGYSGVGFLFLRDLGKPDSLLGAVNVLPIAMTLINIASALVYTRSFSLKGNGPLLFMSLLFLVLLYDQPAALLVYWTMNNVFSLAKNIFLPAPHGAGISSSSQPGILTRAVAAVRALYDGSLAQPGLIAGFSLIVASQNWWLIHRASSFSRCIAVTFLFAGLLSIIALAGYLRRPRLPRIGSRVLGLVISWGVFAVAAYFLFAARRQNAYVSNPNMKMLSTLVLDACACIASTGIVARFRRTEPPPSQAEKGGWVFLVSTCYLFLFVFILSPLQVYFSSPRDVGLTTAALIVRNLPLLLLCTAAVGGLGLLAGRTGRRLPGSAMISIIVVGIMYALISSSRYGVLDEFSLQKAFMLNETSAWYFVLDAAIVTIAAILGRYLWTRGRRIVIPALVVLTLASAAQIASAALKTPPEELVPPRTADSAEIPAGSIEAQRFSRAGRNVVFIIADMFNGNYMGRALDENPRYRAELDGFAWYPNTLSVSSVTATSLPGIYGGLDFSPRRLNEMTGSGNQKLTKAAERFYGGMAKKGYAIAAVDSLYVDLGTLEGVRGTGGALRLESSSYAGFWRAQHKLNDAARTENPKNTLLAMLAVFRCVPFSLKARVYDEGSWILFRKSYQFQYIARKTLATYGYLDLLPQLSSLQETGNTFKFIHTQLTHEPFGVTKDGSIIENDFPDPRTRSFIDGTSAYYSARKFVDFLDHWLAWMKSSGVFDNTLIIVVSDHGNSADDTGVRLPPELDNPFTRADLSRSHALLLVKPFGAHGAVRTDQRLMTNADAAAILFNALGDPSVAGKDPTAGAPGPRTLEFAPLQGSWADFLQNGTAAFNHYIVRNDMFDPRNWSRE